MLIQQKEQNVCRGKVEKTFKSRSRIFFVAASCWLSAVRAGRPHDSRRGRRRYCALLLLAALAVATVSSAQDATGRVFGTVYDQQGAVIAAAQITVTNTATQVARTATADNEGRFQVLALPIGTYTVTAEHSGFRTVVSAEQ